METSTLIALSRQGGLRRQMDIVANNLANMNTTGFKGEKMMFVEHLVRSRGDGRQSRPKLAFARDIATFRDVTEGPLEKTGNPLDMAVSGEGFFVIQAGQGNSYTRNGRFKLDDGGQLVNQSGQPVLSNSGQPFFFGPEDTNISVAKDGTISTINGELGKLAIVRFERPQALKPNAAGQFTTRELPTDVEAPNVAQGVLEGSNVLPIIEMASMIEVHRTYEGVKNFIEKEDDRIKQMIRGMGEAA
jgi:flagellar basal-body rod protein FlgF